MKNTHEGSERSAPRITYRNQQNEEVPNHPLEHQLNHQHKIMVLSEVDIIFQRLRFHHDEVEVGFGNLIQWMSCCN